MLDLKTNIYKKMKILAIDTSSKNASIAITENEEKLMELNNADEKMHSQKLMPMIDEAFKKTGLTLDDIELLTCCLGPGSFTGVRIGIATAKAFADCKNIPAVGVNSLEELAYNLNTEGYVCSLIDAGHGNIYTGFFEIQKDENNRLQTVQNKLTFLNLKEDGKTSEEKLITFLKNNIKKSQKNKINQDDTEKECIYFVGDATVTYEHLLHNLKSSFDNYIIKLANHYQNVASGITLAKVGYIKYKNGEYGDSSILSPVYLRKSQAEIELEEKNKLKN